MFYTEIYGSYVFEFKHVLYGSYDEERSSDNSPIV